MKKVYQKTKLAGISICTFLTISANAQLANVTTISSSALTYPWGVDLNHSNNDLFVGEHWQSDLVKITSAGVSSYVHNDINGYFGPAQVSYDGGNYVYVADAENSVISKIGTGGGRTDIGIWDPVNHNHNGSLGVNHPEGVDVDAAGTVYVADTDNHRIFKISNSTLTVIGGLNGTSGYAEGMYSSRFNKPKGICVVSPNELYVADFGNNAIRKITIDNWGNYNVSTFATGITGPTAIARDANGYFYVTGNHAVYRITPTQYVSLLAGSPGNPGFANGTYTTARFNEPKGIAVNAAGTTVYVGGGLNGSIRKLSLSYPSGGTCASPRHQGDWTNDQAPTTIINNNNPSQGFGNEFGEPSDDIVYSFNLTQQAKVILTTCPEFGGGITDSYIYLLKPCSTIIASSDNSSCGLHGHIEVDNLPAGLYYIIVEGKGSTYGSIMTTYDTEPCGSCRTESLEESNGLNIHEVLTAYPNPSTGTINVKINQLGGTLVVNDLMGKEVEKVVMNPTSSELTLDLSHLKKGMYSLKIEGVKSGKLINLQ